MKFSRYLIWNFLKMFLIVVCGAVLIFVVIDFVGNIKTPKTNIGKSVLRGLCPELCMALISR